MTDAVLGNTYDLDAADFGAIRRNLVDRAIVARTGDPDVPSTAHFDDPHKFGIEAMTPPVQAAVGSARTARVQFWPALKDLSMYSLRIREDGMREPHWHPVTAEMGYVQSGSARMTVMDLPADIGYRTSISAYSREVLAATFNTHIEDLPDFPFTKSDPLIVNRHNPLER